MATDRTTRAHDRMSDLAGMDPQPPDDARALLESRGISLKPDLDSVIADPAVEGVILATIVAWRTKSWDGGESVSQSRLKDQVFSTFTNQNPRFEQQPEEAYAPSGAVPSRRVAAAPTKNIENNPMQSSRRPPQPTVWTENLTRRANQRHSFIIPEFAKRRRARNIDAIMFRVARPLRTRRRRLREGAETTKIRAVSELVRGIPHRCSLMTLFSVAGVSAVTNLIQYPRR